MSASETASALCFPLGVELFHAGEKGFYHFSSAGRVKGQSCLCDDSPLNFFPHAGTVFDSFCSHNFLST